MAWMVDVIYAIAAIATSPAWLPRLARTGRLRTDWAARLGRVPAPVAERAARRPRVLLHAVSVGEVNALRRLVRELEAHPARPSLAIATTTDTGFARARTLFGETHDVVRYPLDFSLAVRRFLNAVRPTVVGLVELEVWPNFTAACARRGVPVAVVNGRLTERSFRRYRRVRALVRPSFARLAAVAAQSEAYAARFRGLGVPPERVEVTGTMKWDVAPSSTDVAGAAALRDALGIDPSRPLVVAGSTAPDEHALLHDAVGASAQLLCAPRRPEWFDGAAADLPGCARRARGERGSATGRFLLDTIGELRQAYALADVVVVGRSFGTLHGSDMMEPVALGKATIVGPAVEDFRDTVDALLAGGGLVQTDRAGLPAAIAALLDDPGRRAELAARGVEVIAAHRGASERHAALLMQLAATGARARKSPSQR